MLDLRYMRHTPTLFLKSVIYLIGLAVLGLCVIIAGVSISGNAGMYLPMLLIMGVAAIPFFYALYQGLLLLSYIDNNAPFSELSVKALRTARYCHFAVSSIYAVGMPYIIWVAEKDDAPGAVAFALLIIFAFLVVGVFTAGVEKLVQNAIDIKSENDLTDLLYGTNHQ